jgi:membrane protein YdbS with pleckstrin-like domain
VNDPSESHDGRIAATSSEPAVTAQVSGGAAVDAELNGGPATGARPDRQPGLPAPAAGDERAVDARTIAVWRWAALIGSVPIAGTAAIFTISMAVAGGPAGDILFIAYPLLLVALGLNAWWYPAARYGRLRYRLDPLGVTITDGILWRTQSSVPRVRIQHTDISQGPLQRRYGVATLKLYTAGSRFTKIELPGLAYGDAVQLRDRLLESGEGDAV